MDIRDVHRNATLQHRNSKESLDVVQVAGDQVEVEHWSPSRREWLPLAHVLEAYETPVQPDGLPTFSVELLEASRDVGVAKKARIEVLEEHPAFVDDDLPVILSATSAGVPALEAYLAALAVGDAWLDRECGGDASVAAAPLAGRLGWSVSLNIESYRKRYPCHWFSVTVGGDGDEVTDPPLKVSVRDESLAKALFEAIASGNVTLSPG
jgi:hypothetical protein